jgi:hypothetical protein
MPVSQLAWQLNDMHAEFDAVPACSTAGMETKASRLDVTFSSLLSKNIDQLKMFNAAIFPIKYQVPRH